MAGGEKEMDAITSDLLTVLYAYLVFLLSFIANILFSMYLNIEVIGFKFDKQKILKSIKRALIVLLGTFALVIAVDAAAIYFAKYIPELNEQIKDLATVVMVIATIGRAALKYIKEAYATFVNILDSKKSTNQITVSGHKITSGTITTNQLTGNIVTSDSSSIEV